ncbi:MAG: prolipoprotein diacylglyceryl transferase family protein [Myxococcota bacterium]
MAALIPWFEQPILELNEFIPGLPDGAALHGFGLFVALGFVFGGMLAKRRADRYGLSSASIDQLITWLIVGTFVGGHFGYGIMYEPAEYFANPIKFLEFWHGLSSFGGFVVCVPLAVYFFYSKKMPVWPYLDCLAYGLAMGWFLGRMGCFVAHDHPGAETTFFLGVYCQPIPGHVLDLPGWLVQGDGSGMAPWGPCARDGSIEAVHDTGLYEALWSLGMLGVLTWLDRRPTIPGTLTLTYGLTYGPVRFMTDFLRPEYSDPRVFGFTPAQWWSSVFTMVCLAALYWRLQSDEEPLVPIEDQPKSKSEDTPEPSATPS